MMNSLLPTYNPNQPDFKIFSDMMTLAFNPLFTGSIEATENLVFMTGSSTIKDLQDDTMALTALQDMTQVDPHLSIWMNHDYELPGKLYGSLACSPIMAQQGGIADLHLAVDTEIENPDALQTLRYIKKGRRLGCSGGFKVLEWEVDGDPDDWFAPLIIIHVYTVEWSVVGVPANQRSWVENAASGLFLRSLAEGKDEDARRLAPIIKGLFPRDYQSTLKQLSNDALRRDLERMPERPSKSKLLWEPLRKTFIFQQNGISQELDHQKVGQLLEKLANDRDSKQESIPEEEKQMEGLLPGEKMIDSLLIKADGTHATYTGTHTHAHKAFGSQGDDDMHEHEHSHDGDAQHDHPHQKSEHAEQQAEIVPQAIVEENHETETQLQASSPAEPDEPKSFTATDAMRQSFISMGLALGYDMSLLTQSPTTKGLTKAHLVHAQAIHDHITRMTDGAVCAGEGSAGGTEGEDVGDARQQAEQERDTQMSWRKSLDMLSMALKGIEGIDIKTLRNEIIVMQAAANTTREEVEQLRLQASGIQKQLQQTMQDIDNLRNMPLARPTVQQRQVEDTIGMASYEEMRQAGHQEVLTEKLSLSEALAMTKIIEQNGNALKYREWPSGLIPENGRPPLTGDERSLMHPMDVLRYEENQQAKVPILD